MNKPTQDRSKTIRSVYDQEIIDSDNMNLSAIFFFKVRSTRYRNYVI